MAANVQHGDAFNGSLDGDGAVFLDRDPELFRLVLGYLRTGHLFIPPTVSKLQLDLELDYYGVECQRAARSPAVLPSSSTFSPAPKKMPDKMEVSRKEEEDEEEVVRKLSLQVRESAASWIVEAKEWWSANRIQVLVRLRDSMGSYRRRDDAEGERPQFYCERVPFNAPYPTCDEQFWSVVRHYAQVDLPGLQFDIAEGDMRISYDYVSHATFLQRPTSPPRSHKHTLERAISPTHKKARLG